MKRKMTIAPALALALAQTLASCGAGAPETEPVDTPGTATQDGTTTDDGHATPDDSRATGDASSEVPDEIVAVIGTAEDEAGGTAYELDDQDDESTWEVDVAVGDRSVEVTASADGTQVREVNGDNDLDDEDRRALEAATITILDAMGIALAERPGTLDRVDLNDEQGTFVWEVTIDTPERTDVEVYVDVTNGEIVRIDG